MKIISDAKIAIESNGDVYVVGTGLKPIKLTDGLVLSGIEVTEPPTKVEYVAGELFDATGMIITATYTSGSKVDVRGYTCSPSVALKTTDTKITISYTENGVTKTATQNITVTEPEPEVLDEQNS